MHTNAFIDLRRLAVRETELRNRREKSPRDSKVLRRVEKSCNGLPGTHRLGATEVQHYVRGVVAYPHTIVLQRRRISSSSMLLRSFDPLRKDRSTMIGDTS